MGDGADPIDTPAAPGLSQRLDDALRRYGLHAALVVALVATLGSLYFSNVRLYKPCVLCWYQRVFMYPIGLTLATAIIARDRRVARYVIPAAVAGTAVAVYHVLLQKTDWLPETPACVLDVPCSADYIYWLGFITIPVLSLTAFLLILLFVAATMGSGASMAPQPEAGSDAGSDAVWWRRPWLQVGVIIVVTIVVFIGLWAIDSKAAVKLGDCRSTSSEMVA